MFNVLLEEDSRKMDLKECRMLDQNEAIAFEGSDPEFGGVKQHLTVPRK